MAFVQDNKIKYVKALLMQKHQEAKKKDMHWSTVEPR